VNEEVERRRRAFCTFRESLLFISASL